MGQRSKGRGQRIGPTVEKKNRSYSTNRRGHVDGEGQLMGLKQSPAQDCHWMPVTS